MEPNQESNLKEHRPRLLLHSCCGPCSTYVISSLIDAYDVTVYYYNPNIDTLAEFDKRLDAQKSVIDKLREQRGLDEHRLNLVTGVYDNEKYLEAVRGLELEPEHGLRCSECFKLRLDEAARFAKENGYDVFTTTLSVSPHKNAKELNRIGFMMACKYDISYMESDFKKKNGYLISVTMSKEMGLYRQKYCGCKFAKGHLKEVTQ